MFNKTIDKIYAGVSQQPFNERLDAHTEEQINVINDTVKGSYKRPPSNFINRMTVNELSYSNVIQVNEEKYILTLDTDKFEPLKIHDLKGNKKTVTYDEESSLDYINDNNVKYNTNYRHKIDFNKYNHNDFSYTDLYIDDFRIRNQETNKTISYVFDFFVDYITNTLPQYELFNINTTNYTFEIEKKDNGSIVNNFVMVYINNSAQSIIYGDTIVNGVLNNNVKNLKEIYKTVDIKDNIILVNKNVKVESIKNKNDLEKEVITQITPYYYNIDFSNMHETGDFIYERRLTIKIEGRTFTTRTTKTKNIIKRIVGFINKTSIYEAEYSDRSGFIVKKKNGGKIKKLTGKLYYRYNGRKSLKATKIESGGTTITTGVKKFYNFIEITKSVNGTKYSVDIKTGELNNLTYSITASGSNLNVTASHLAAEITNSSSVYGAMSKNQFILIYREDDKLPFSIGSRNSENNNYIKTIGHTINNASDLPVDGFFENYVIKIDNDSNNEYDNYYTIFNNGHWKEWSALNIDNDLSNDTLPRIITYDEENDLFEVTFLDVEPRLVGDNTSAPMPDFVEKKILDLVVFKNRLGILSDNSISFSSSKNYYSFFPETVKRISGEDPIDLSVSINEKVNMRYAVSFENKLILFSKERQFVLEGEGNEITLTNVSITPVTKNVINDSIYPVSLENSLFYAIDNNNFSSIVEYNTDSNNSKYTDNITTHVPEYIPNTVSKMVGDGNKNKLFITEEGYSKEIYFYSGFTVGNNKIQEAWSKLHFDNCDFIKNIEYIDNKLYILYGRKTGSNIINYLEYIDLENNTENLVCLDSKIIGENRYGKKYTKTDNKYGISPGLYTVYYLNWEKYTSHIHSDTIRYDSLFTDKYTGLQDTLKRGQVIRAEVNTDDGSYLVGNLLFIPGDYSNYLEYPIVGIKYNMEIKLSPMILKDYKGKTDNISKVKIKDVSIGYYDTKYINIEVQQIGRSIKNRKFIFDTNKEGNAKSLVMSDKNTVSIKITNDSVWQTFINSIDYRGIISKVK